MAPDPLDYFAIRNTLARYAIALDTKNFDLLNDVFTEDVDASYPFNNGLKGVRAVADAIQARHASRTPVIRPTLTAICRLAPITSQHALTTQTIEVAEDGQTAKATTYFTGVHFGQGRWVGQQVTAYGQYVDELVKVKGTGDGGEVASSAESRRWLIAKRVVCFTARLGEERVMESH